MGRILLIVGALAVAGAAGWFALEGGASQANTEPVWRTVSADRGPIVASVSATGTVNPTATALVGSQLSGQVVEILADHNSNVRAGQILARLNSDQIRAKLDAARADLAQARATNLVQRAQVERNRAETERAAATRADVLAQNDRAQTLLQDAETTLGRQLELRSRGIASEVALQQARTQRDSLRAARESAEAQLRSSAAQINALAAELKVAEAQVAATEAVIAQKEAFVRQIEVDIANSTVRSPVDGVVIQRNIELGQTVAASLQAPTLFLVAQDLTRMEIYANVDEADVGRVLPGQAVTFSVNAFPNRSFNGTVKLVRLGSQTVQNVVIYTAIIEVMNEGLELKPGMTATLRIFTERRANVLRVPNAALRWRPSGAPAESAGAQPQAALAADDGGEGARPRRGESGPGQGEPGQGGSGQGRGGSGGGGPGGGGPGAIMAFAERLSIDLGFDEVQRQQLEGIMQELRRRFAADGPPTSPEQRRSRARDLRATFLEKVAAILKPEQMAAFEAAKAEVSVGRTQRIVEGVPARVYVLSADGRPVPTPIRIGPTDGAYTEIVAGLVPEGSSLIIGGGPKPETRRRMPFGF
jgi:HlyD family secretion protein